MNKLLRQHHKHRQFKKRKKDLMYLSVFELKPINQLIHVKHFKMRMTTPTLCSCWLCGNPRKFYGNGKNGKTIQELKAINDEYFGLMDYYQAVL